MCALSRLDCVLGRVSKEAEQHTHSISNNLQSIERGGRHAARQAFKRYFCRANCAGCLSGAAPWLGHPSGSSRRAASRAGCCRRRDATSLTYCRRAPRRGPWLARDRSSWTGSVTRACMRRACLPSSYLLAATPRPSTVCRWIYVWYAGSKNDDTGAKWLLGRSPCVLCERRMDGSARPPRTHDATQMWKTVPKMARQALRASGPPRACVKWPSVGDPKGRRWGRGLLHEQDIEGIEALARHVPYVGGWSAPLHLTSPQPK